MLWKLFSTAFGKSQRRERKKEKHPQPQTADSLLKAIPVQEPRVLAPDIIELWPSMDEQDRQQLREQAQDYGWEAYFITDLEDAVPEKRLVAIEILGLIGGKQSVWPLLNALASKNEDVCFTAANALKELQAPNLMETLIDILAIPERWPPARVAEIILARGSEGVMPLLERLPIAPAASRGYIIELLGELEDVRAVPYLINVIEDDNPVIRAKGASALARLNGPVTEVTDSLLRALEDEAWEVRAQAALAAGNMGLKEAAPTLETLVSEDPDWRVQENARKAIEQLSVVDERPPS
ncbi:MAG: HEAT repeat domain-containing protein [Clostridia bacterium]|jgi:HEAT repeat protein|nr:HEAT repeat domain-containing protein [Clostridia bacterium]